MRYIKAALSIIVFASLQVACTDKMIIDPPTEEKEGFNIDAFSEGYSLAFDLKLDKLGGDMATRDGDALTDLEIEAWENYIDPEEFRVLFFDSQDRFLFESSTRWFTQIESQSRGSRWRVGIPVFQYLSDGYDENISTKPDYSMDEEYNWERIAEIMRTESFKIAILANRPFDINVPDLSDLDRAEKGLTTFGKNGPFWGPANSIASYVSREEQETHEADIRNLFDLHHCQYDPFYESKSEQEEGTYDFVMQVYNEKLNNNTEKPVPHMGAVSSWIHSSRKLIYDPGADEKKNGRYYYKLPKGQILEYDNRGNVNKKKSTERDQYIPMYGMQQFSPLTTWNKGTTYYLSEQSGSQIGNYDYKYIYLLRSVVKLELRIPKYEANGDEIIINNEFAHLCASNFMARCEPMDIWTPTDQIWDDDHLNDCEWINIKNYGLYADGTKDYIKKLSWFYGAWKKDGKWDFNGYDGEFAGEEVGKEYPRVYNSINQRQQRTMITDCYLPIENKNNPNQAYHRWIIYCGERNMNDPNKTNDLSSTPYIASFRIQVTRKINGKDKNIIYNLPIVDYSNPDNPIWDFYKEEEGQEGEEAKIDLKDLGSYPQYLENGSGLGNKGYTNGYYKAVRDSKNPDYYPYPLLRNHLYRLTVSFGDGDDINVQVMDGEKRIVGGIEFK